MAMIRMARFPLLFGGLIYYLLGAFLAAAAGYPLLFSHILIGYAILGPAHLSVHYSNDYFDAEGDRRGRPTAVSGGSGVLAARPDLRPRARTMALLLIAVSFAVGVWAYLTVLPTPFLPLLLVLGNAIGWFYSAPPVRLSSRGLGELSTAVAIGLLIPGMGYLAIAGDLDLTFLLAALPLLLYGLTFILAVEMPDREADALSGKRTFVVRHGIRTSLRLILVTSLGASLFYLVVPFTGLLPPVIPSGNLLFASLIPLTPALLANLHRERSRDPAVFVSMQGLREDDPGILVTFARWEVACLILFGAVSSLFLLVAVVFPA
jgi:1,4-dihydroxy-2-naphthoate polyprenyltransferase